jgi:phenylpropionate dioxygenase-like ring-hydroxylating dioxygenase large terminal subunit
LDYPKLEYNSLSEQDKYDLQWYVVGEQTEFDTDKPQKVTIWNTNYVVWKKENGDYVGLHDVCPHRGASLSGGKVCNNHVICPYHGYEYSENGILSKVPGISFQLSPVHNIAKYDVIEKNGWVYLNTYSLREENNETFSKNIYVESKELKREDSCVYLNMPFECYSRVLSENSLDIMHIGFVHTFGNTENPTPIELMPPTQISKNHYKSVYMYEAGKKSFARKVFKIKELIVENEFILPHTTVARVIFGDYSNTVITFALPINDKQSKLFVKTYRNFWSNIAGDFITGNMMWNTMLQDRIIVENIDHRFMNGKFNMKFDKLQNTYKTFYEKFIRK